MGEFFLRFGAAVLLVAGLYSVLVPRDHWAVKPWLHVRWWYSAVLFGAVVAGAGSRVLLRYGDRYVNKPLLRDRPGAGAQGQARMRAAQDGGRQREARTESARADGRDGSGGRARQAEARRVWTGRRRRKLRDAEEGVGQWSESHVLREGEGGGGREGRRSGGRLE